MTESPDREQGNQTRNQASSYFVQSKKSTGYCHLIWANLSKHTDTQRHMLNFGKHFPPKVPLTALHLPNIF